MPASSKNAWRILLVDDNVQVCIATRRLLEYDGRKVEVATNAQEALALCEKHHFDVILIDYFMPGINGDKLAATIKERLPNQPIILITADEDTIEETENKPAGVDLIMGKPCGLKDLRGAIEKVLPEA